MIGHIYNSRFIRFCLILNVNSIIICQFHSNCTIQVSGKPFFTVFRQISQLHFPITHLSTFIYTILEPLRASMQTMTIIVLR